ncbi:hypothetical protein AB0M80_28395 [Amycolatopsis sp. NPDC051045]|uniref:hypothetical protein n=1 Tax=Amycolatopsis sp. NPDC051045 TaxID=3156922 RepID=UPI00341B8195
MPGWYVHLEAAKQTAQRLRDGDIPPGFPLDLADSQALGETCHTWRNYLALGSLGPDLFYLLPDFANTTGCVIRQVIRWVVDVWAVLDAQFVAKWEKWIDPIQTNDAQLTSQLTGGLSNQLGAILDELSAAVTSAFEGLLARMGDWFGLLTSGVPQGYGNDAFYWSDMFHYRHTYQFPYTLFRQAEQARAAATTDAERLDADARTAFAVGWMSHCATDVTGHPFTNAKAGGPYRDHWQRHHLVENHMDSENYSARNPGPCYGERGTSALHFYVAFRARHDQPYDMREDAPAYDYFAGFPAYDTSDGATPAAARRALFDLDSGELPESLVAALLDAMAEVYPDGPKILTQDPQFSAADASGTPDGRPNSDALNQMWTLVYAYLKVTGSDGLSPRRPAPPSVFTNHSFPTPPGGGGYGVDDDPARGADVDDDDSFSLLDLVLAIFAWVVYLAQIIEWLVTVLPGLIVDVLTFPVREVLYWAVVVPAWNLYVLARRALVMSGFLTPKPEEVDLGLTTLGSASGTYDVAAALDSPLGDGAATFRVTEPSGRETATSGFGLDPAYPRGIVRDQPADVSAVDLPGMLGLTRPLRYAGDGIAVFKPTEWIAPWRYPLTGQAGKGVPQEGAPAHVGPFVAGDGSTVLLPGPRGSTAARNRLEDCKTPAETFAALDALLPDDLHLGGPVDYGLYLIGRMATDQSPEFRVPDFNLDSDRGYAWLCWGWDRHHAGAAGEWVCFPLLTATPQSTFSYRQPCTPPQFFHADHDNPHRLQPDGTTPLDSQWYDPRLDLKVHYLGHGVEQPPADDEDPCGMPGPPHEPFDGTGWRHRLPGKERIDDLGLGRRG